MKIIFTGGGTAGHINPALAVAELIRKNEPKSEILYVGSQGGLEESLVKKAGFQFKGIKISGFSRKLNFAGIKKNIITVKNILVALKQSKKILKEFKPDVCVGTGGYVSGPLLKLAELKGIPVLIHEQNAVAGFTTKLLSKKAKTVMLASNEAKKYLSKGCNIVITGNPIRREIVELAKQETNEEVKEKLGFKGKPTVLSFGGSMGARKINEAVAGLMAWSVKNDKYNHMHAYGKYGKWFKDLLKEKGVNPEAKALFIQEYIEDMPLRMAAADIIICRAGAITLSEIKALGKPAILIPSPNVAENHQYHNAMELVNIKAAEVIEEKDLTGEILIEKVEKLMSDKKLRDLYSQNLKRTAVLNANERIYNEIKLAANQTKKQ